MKKYLFIIIFLLAIINIASTQVTGVKYLIEYNQTTHLYDCKIVIDEGEAITYVERKQYNSQYSIVVPTGSQVSIGELHNPIASNHDYNGTVPCVWELAPPFTSPVGQPESDFYYLFPNLAPQLAYDNLYEGDTVTLFSLNVDVDPCENAVRPFEKGIDSNAGFSCSFKFAGAVETYTGNVKSVFNNNIIPFDSTTICLNDCLELNPTLSCFKEDNLSFEWSTGESTKNIEVCPTEATDYYLIVRNSSGNILDTLSLFVDVNQIVLGLNDSEICVNSNTVVETSIPGGLWESTDPTVASIDSNTGVITGNTSGEVEFKYSGPNGYSKTTEKLIVNDNPIIYPPEFICTGGELQITSNSEGEWSSSDQNIASINNDGVLTGIAAGSVSLMFTDSGTNCSISADVNIQEEHYITNTGSDTLCAYDHTVLVPYNGGSWDIAFMSDTFVATFDNFGLVTAIKEGKIVFSFSSNVPGCGVSVLDTIYVFDLPEVEYIGDERICIGDTISILPNLDDTFEIYDTTVASLDASTGLITGLAQGYTSIQYVDTITGCSNAVASLIVDPNPTVYVQDNEICIGEEGILIPTHGGEWTALDSEVVAIDSFSFSAISEGNAGFLYTSSATGCISDTLSMTVHPLPNTSLLGPSEICIGETTILEPSVGGTWSISDNSIASVTSGGLVIGVSSGQTTGIFTDATTNCASEPSDIITVLPSPFSGIFEPIKLCVGETALFFPNTYEGLWESDNPEVLTIDETTGMITTISSGTATISFSDETNECITSTTVNVFASPIIEFTGSDAICVGTSTTISSNSTGSISIENPSIATVDNFGFVVGVSPGTTIITFIDSNSGCASEPLLLTVLPASDPSCIVSTKDLKNHNIKIYPNPAKEFINIESESLIESISIYSLGYQKLKEEVYNISKNRTQVHTNGINQGLYLLAVKTRENTYFKKIIIE